MTDFGPDIELDVLVFPGKDGAIGPIGSSGYSGYSGFSGKSGSNGLAGYNGLSGYSGFSGYSGYSGISGYSGSGESGYSGYSGQDLRDKERQHDFVTLAFSYSFCGTAPLGSLTSDPVWTLTLIEIGNAGITNVWTIPDMIWDARLNYIPG